MIKTVQDYLDQSESYENQGELAQSWKFARRALEEAQQCGERQGQAQALLQLARIEYLQGDSSESVAHVQDALAVSDPETPEIVRAWMILGNCAVLDGDLDRAESLYSKALDLARRFGSPNQRMICLHNLANGIYLLRGQFDLALSYELESFRLAKQYDLKKRLFLNYITLNWIYFATGKFEEARALIADWHTCEPLSEADSGYRCLLAGGLALADGDLQQAIERYQQSLAQAEMYGEPGWLVEIYLGMSRCRRHLHEHASALDWVNQALNLAQKHTSYDMIGVALIERACIAWEAGNLQSACVDLQAAMRSLERMGCACEMARATLLLAGILRQVGDAQADAAFLEAGWRILQGNYLFLLDLERSLALPLLAQQLDRSDLEISALADKLLQALSLFPPVPLRVHTLGGLSLRIGARTLTHTDLRARRSGELLALLLSSPGCSLDAEQISEGLLPEYAPEAGQALVYKAVSELRRILEPELPDRRFPSRYLESIAGRVVLHLPPGSSLDFQAFQEAVRQGNWEQAVALYGGEYLPEYRYAEWTIWLRETLSQDYQVALLHLAEQRLAADLWPEALGFARRLLALDAWNENAALIAMQACQAMGNPSAARRVYHRLEKVLHEELNLQPSEDLQRFARSLAKQRKPGG